MLSDPRKRAAYDTRGFAGVAVNAPEDLWAGIGLGDLFEPFGFDVGGSLFERLFYPSGRKGPRRGRDLHVVPTIPLAVR